MAIHTLYFTQPARRVTLALQAIVGSSNDISFEIIPADGGCVVALIYEDAKSSWAPQSLAQGRLRKRIEAVVRQLAIELGGAPGTVTDVAPA